MFVIKTRGIWIVSAVSRYRQLVLYAFIFLSFCTLTKFINWTIFGCNGLWWFFKINLKKERSEKKRKKMSTDSKHKYQIMDCKQAYAKWKPTHSPFGKMDGEICYISFRLFYSCNVQIFLFRLHSSAGVLFLRIRLLNYARSFSAPTKTNSPKHLFTHNISLSLFLSASLCSIAVQHKKIYTFFCI